MTTIYNINEAGKAKLTAFLRENFKNYAAIVSIRKEENCVESIFATHAEKAEWAFAHGDSAYTATISADQGVDGKGASCVLTVTDFDVDTLPAFD